MERQRNGKYGTQWPLDDGPRNLERDLCMRNCGRNRSFGIPSLPKYNPPPLGMILIMNGQNRFLFTRLSIIIIIIIIIFLFLSPSPFLSSTIAHN